jgi:hypothetical protein
LGDDVVIGNSDVARAYLLLLQAIGVEVGLAKSLISKASTFEFAKRTFRVTANGSLVDIGGISLDAIGAAITDPSVLEALLLQTNAISAREGLRIAARILGYGFRTRSALGSAFSSMNSRLMGLSLLLTRPSSVWAMPFTQWLLQETVEVPQTLSDEEMGVLSDSVRQRLVDAARKLVDVRLRALQNWGIPIDKAGNSESKLSVRIPHFMRKDFLVYPKGDQAPEYVRSPLYEMFLAEWVFKPLLDQVRSDLDQLLADLDLWATGETSDGNFSLDEIYLSLNRLIDELQAVDIEIQLFIRRSSDEAPNNAKRRSAAVKLWKACRKVISGFHARKHGKTQPAKK